MKVKLIDGTRTLASNGAFALNTLQVGITASGLLSGPFHAADDIQQSGSVTFFNSDVVDSLELMSGGFPAKYGERTGAVLDIDTREGSQERVLTCADIGMAGLAATNEGPIGNKASWIVSAVSDPTTVVRSAIAR